MNRLVQFCGTFVLTLGLLLGGSALADQGSPSQAWAPPATCGYDAFNVYHCVEGSPTAELPTPTPTDAEEVLSIEILPGTGVGTANDDEPVRAHQGWGHIQYACISWWVHWRDVNYNSTHTTVRFTSSWFPVCCPYYPCG